MTQIARIWVNGGQEHDEEFRFKDILDLLKQLKALQTRWQWDVYEVRLHGEPQKKFFKLPKGDVELDMIRIPLTAEGED